MNLRTLADRWLVTGHARFVSACLLAMVVGLTVVQLATSKPGGTVFGPVLGGDFAAFYAEGLLLDRLPLDRLYDAPMQDRLLHQTLPAMPSREQLPFAYPPFLAPLFWLLARVPFAGSYAIWLVISFALYAASVALMLRGCTSLSSRERSTVWLLALSFQPFLLESWMGGQLSSLGCLAVASALTFRRANRPFLCGIALSALMYKPSLPLLLFPLLIVGRQWRVIGGFTVGAVVLGLTSLGIAGEAGCLDFARLMAGYGSHGASGIEGFKTSIFVDLRSFLTLLGFAGRNVTALALLLGLPMAAGLALVWLADDQGPRSDFAWSAALCLTPILSLYGPVYDVSLIVPGLILAAEAIRRRDGEGWPLAFRWLVAFVYLSSWISQALAVGIGFQLLTVAVASMGVYLLREALRPA